MSKEKKRIIKMIEDIEEDMQKKYTDGIPPGAQYDVRRMASSLNNILLEQMTAPADKPVIYIQVTDIINQEVFARNLHEESLTSLTFSNKNTIKHTNTIRQQNFVSSDKETLNTHSSSKSFRDDSSKNQRITFHDNSANNEKPLPIVKLNKAAPYISRNLAYELLNQFITWIKILPLSLQELLLHSTPVKIMIESTEQIAVIYDKKINVTDLFDKKLSEDFNFDSDKTVYYRKYFPINEDVVVRHNTCATEPFDTSIIDEEQYVEYDIISIDMIILSYRDYDLSVLEFDTNLCLPVG